MDDNLAENSASVDAVAGPKSKKKLILIILALLLLIGGGAGYYFVSKHNKQAAEEELAHKKPAKEEAKNLYVDLGKMLVNLNTNSTSQASFIDIKITIEVGGQEAADKITAQLPNVRDSFQTYLRELRPEDVQGTTAMMQLKEDLLNRITKLLYPIDVKEILIPEFIIQ